MQRSTQGLPRPGDVLAGRFQVERLLGAGGMGSVFCALDRSSGQRVAIKLMLPQFVENAEFSSRFMREARAAASLTSRHVARVHEVSELPDGALFMVMELLHGMDLARLVSTRGPLSIVEVAGYIVETCDAIAEAHARGFVHRDLKPSNLFLADQPGARPIVKVLDFGISKSTGLDASGSAEALTATDSSLGSPQYMSPEQLRSAKNVDARTDIWSLGVILHKLLTGTLAFEADSVGAHLAMIITDPPTPLRKRRPDAPVELENILLRCLQRDLSLRYQNVGQLAVALAPFAPPEARPEVERIITIVGRDAALAKPLPLKGASEIPTAPGWSPNDAPTALYTPKRSSAPLMIASGALFFAFIGLAATAAIALRPAAPKPTEPAVASAPAAPMKSAHEAPVDVKTVETKLKDVRITIEIEPADATIEIDGAKIEGHTIVLPSGEGKHTITAHAQGYLPETREVSAKDDSAIAIVLRRPEHVAPRSGKKLKGPLETNL